MFEKMLIATDLSKACGDAMCALVNLKHIGTKSARLVYCFNIRDVGTQAGHLIELMKPEFERQKKILWNAGFKAEGEIVMGLPEIEIKKQAEEHGCSFIVVEAGYSSMLGEIFLGGIASAVIQTADRPVLVLRFPPRKDGNLECIENWKCGGLQNILFPTDFSDNSERAYEYVRHIAACAGGRVTLLHVQEESRIEPHLRDKLAEFNRIDTERLERLQEDLEKAGAEDVAIEIVTGSPKKEIIERTSKNSVSLAVMGAQGRGFIGEIFLGSISHAVVRKSSVPVLLVPHPVT